MQFKIEPNSNLYFHQIIADIVSYVESSNFKTVEALVSKIGQLTFQKYDGVAEVVATVTKPNLVMLKVLGYHLPWSKTISKIWNQLNLKTQLLKLIEHSIYRLK